MKESISPSGKLSSLFSLAVTSLGLQKTPTSSESPPSSSSSSQHPKNGQRKKGTYLEQHTEENGQMSIFHTNNSTSQECSVTAVTKTNDDTLSQQQQQRQQQKAQIVSKYEESKLQLNETIVPDSNVQCNGNSIDFNDSEKYLDTNDDSNTVADKRDSATVRQKVSLDDADFDEQNEAVSPPEETGIDAYRPQQLLKQTNNHHNIDKGKLKNENGIENNDATKNDANDEKDENDELSKDEDSDTGTDEGLSEYELLRLRKIKRNQERMKQLGLFNLSRSIKLPETPKITSTPKRVKRTPMEVTPRTLPRRKARDNVTFPYGEDGEEQDMNTPFKDKPKESESKPRSPKLVRMYTPVNNSRSQFPKGKMRRFRCQRCAACQMPDCGKCAHCRDKKKFGGPDRLRQACLLRQTCEEWLIPDVVDTYTGLGIYENVLEVLWGFGRIDICSICHIGGDLLKCNMCRDSIHLRCNIISDKSSIHLSRIGKWTCHRCTSRKLMEEKQEDIKIEKPHNTNETTKSDTSLKIGIENSNTSLESELKQPSTVTDTKSITESDIQAPGMDEVNKNKCAICNIDGATGTCGYCGKMYHDYCHIPSLSSMKPGKFKCMACIAPSRQRKTRCGECIACCRPDCGMCEYCLDKPKFGGKNVKRKPCKERKCRQYNFSKMSSWGYKAVMSNEVVTLPIHIHGRMPITLPSHIPESKPTLINHSNTKNSAEENENKNSHLTSENNLSHEHANKENQIKKEDEDVDEVDKHEEINEDDIIVEDGFEDDNNADVCQICNKTGNLICCDKCPRSFHSKCLGVKEKDLPEEYWECRFCKDDVIAKPDDIIYGEKSFGEINWAFSSLVEANHADLVYSKMLIVSKIYELIDFLMKYDFGDVFSSPVVNVTGYRKIITRPMDLGTIQKNIMKGVYYRNAIRSYSSETKRAIHGSSGDQISSHGVIDVAILEILKDIETVWHNCFVFNLEDSVYFRMAQVQRRKCMAMITSTFYDHLDPYVLSNLTEFESDCRLFEKMEIEQERDEEKLEEELLDKKSETNDKKGTNNDPSKNKVRKTKRKYSKNKLSMPRKRRVNRRQNDESDESPGKKRRKRKLKDSAVIEKEKVSSNANDGPKGKKRRRSRKSEADDSPPKKRGRPRKSDVTREASNTKSKLKSANSDKPTSHKDISDAKDKTKVKAVVLNPEKLKIIASSRKRILKTLTPKYIKDNMKTKVVDVVLATIEAIDKTGEKPRTIIFNEDHFFNEHTKIRQIKKPVDKRRKKLKKDKEPVSTPRRFQKRKVTMKDTRVMDLVIV